MPILFRAIRRLQWKHRLKVGLNQCNTNIWGEWLTRRSLLSHSSIPIFQNSRRFKKKTTMQSHLYGLESTTSALIFSILGLWSSRRCASSMAHCFCLHFINSFSNSLTRSFSSSTVAILWIMWQKKCKQNNNHIIINKIDLFWNLKSS